jgi:hypothetical protein
LSISCFLSSSDIGTASIRSTPFVRREAVPILPVNWVAGKGSMEPSTRSTLSYCEAGLEGQSALPHCWRTSRAAPLSRPAVTLWDFPYFKRALLLMVRYLQAARLKNYAQCHTNTVRFCAKCRRVSRSGDSDR